MIRSVAVIWLLRAGLVALALCLTACDPVVRHKTLSTIFDGVPTLPPTDEYCVDFARQYHQEQLGLAKVEVKEEGPKGSTHLPYGEKRCADCHGSDKDKSGGLVVPKQELCFKCHPGFLKGAFQHGPAAVGDCLACHLPHAAPNPDLLGAPRDQICGRCHTEERLTNRMHDRLKDSKIACVECHDPHASDARYLLR